jgi:hypothetical protein
MCEAGQDSHRDTAAPSWCLRRWMVVFPVWSSDHEAKRRMVVNGYSTVKEREAAAINNKDDNRFFRHQGYCSTRICSARANGQPRSLHLRTQVHSRGTSTSSSWPVGIWTVDSVARQCETTHSAKCLTKHVTVLPHPPYSPDQTTRYFFLFPRLKKRLKSCCDDGAHRHSERGPHQLLSGLAEILATVYWLGGNYFEGDRKQLVVRLNFVFFTDSVSELYGQRMYTI